MDVLALLKRDHQTVRALFSKFEQIGKTAHQKRAELFEQIRFELWIHSKAEEEIFYPALKGFNGQGRNLVTHALKEHREMDELLTQISRLSPQNERFDDRLEALMEDVDHHIEQEEREIFRFAKENCPHEQLVEMAVDIEKRKTALQRQLAA